MQKEIKKDLPLGGKQEFRGPFVHGGVTTIIKSMAFGMSAMGIADGSEKKN